MAAIVPDDICRRLGKRIANDVLDGFVDKKHGYTIRQIANMLENEELVPVRHGRWVENEDYNGDSYYTCSACGETWVMIDGTPTDNNMNYCPHCGAKMDGEHECGPDYCEI